MTDQFEHQVGSMSSISDPQQKAEWLNQQIQAALEHTERKRRENQRRASYIKVSAILLSGLATLLLGLRIAGIEEHFGNIAFAFVALVTVLNALEPYFNFRALWVEHELAIARFHRLKDELNFYLAGTKPGKVQLERLSEIHKEYQEIWNNLADSWIRHRKGQA